MVAPSTPNSNQSHPILSKTSGYQNTYAKVIRLIDKVFLCLIITITAYKNWKLFIPSALIGLGISILYPPSGFALNRQEEATAPPKSLIEMTTGVQMPSITSIIEKLVLSIFELRKTSSQWLLAPAIGLAAGNYLGNIYSRYFS